jgi:hypothetical protein
MKSIRVIPLWGMPEFFFTEIRYLFGTAFTLELQRDTIIVTKKLKILDISYHLTY